MKKIIYTILLLIFLSPAFANAQGIQVQVQEDSLIAQLQAQIASLKAQIEAILNPQSTWYTVKMQAKGADGNYHSDYVQAESDLVKLKWNASWADSCSFGVAGSSKEVKNLPKIGNLQKYIQETDPTVDYNGEEVYKLYLKCSNSEESDIGYLYFKVGE